MVRPKPLLLVVDVQNDFCPGGALGVPNGNDVVAPLNQLISRFRASGRPLIFSRDWHPPKTKHFREFGGVWPPHCVQGTKGAEFHPDLAVPRGATIASKGMDPDVDAYSCFQAFLPDGEPVPEWLDRKGIRRLVIGGLATDYCVLRTALDARAAGYDFVVLADAVRAVDLSPGDGDRAMEEMRRAGAEFAQSKDFVARLPIPPPTSAQSPQRP